MAKLHIALQGKGGDGKGRGRLNVKDVGKNGKMQEKPGGAACCCLSCRFEKQNQETPDDPAPA
ncbi:hypothetical protein KP001_00285 [Geomonas subterranea]|uniref:Uncharacterized protein n=1 Tax=Geomonas subterranea TaxID=2847989 RepID=A0ABX8LH86_9BACT|nr:hypothetical protein [Geomonas subterranea]QXE91022.1 hypothetical protein KP001_00285 [Geomonas subterranea]QXM10893.1 hypothetical protein KP002_07195 [Geomonas subterranea]